MNSKKRFLPLLTALLLTFTVGAQAATDFDGKVVDGETVTVTAPYGGTVKSISLREGALIAVGDEVAAMQTTSVLAPEDGTIRGIFAQEGDLIGASTVMYLQPVRKYTISCSIENAYPSVDMKFVHIGETLYIKCSSDGTHKAVGIVTAVSGSQYTVQTTAGELYLEETVYLYRSADYTYKTKVGSGTVARTDEVAIAGSASSGSSGSAAMGTASAASASAGSASSVSLLKLCVSDGEEVERGQLLFETVEGDLDALGVYSETIQSDAAGVIASINVKAGDKISKGDVLLTVYQPNTYRVEFSVTEDELKSISVGDTVNLTFDWNEGAGSVQGVVTEISYLSEDSATSTTASAAGASALGKSSSSSSTSFTAYVDFQPTDDVRLGMSVTLETTK